MEANTLISGSYYSSKFQFYLVFLKISVTLVRERVTIPNSMLHQRTRK